MLLGAVLGVLEANGVTRHGTDVVLVACSGGMDSVALSHASVELLGARRVVLAHVDHRVRPDSAQDAVLVRRLADRLGATALFRELVLGPASEARLRALRYEALEDARSASGARYALTAHTEDDQAETVLLGLVRSARLSSLAGIPQRRGAIVRPLLGVPRAEVRAYAAANRLAFRDDPTNLEPRYLRNRIRKELLPLLERRYRPGMARRLARLARAVRWAASAPAPVAGGADRLGLSEKHESSRVSTELDAVRAGGPIACELRGWQGGPVPDGRSSAIFDAELLAAPVIRLPRAGDRIQTFGMDGRRKLRDVFREAKIPATIRETLPIVADDRGRVVWVPGVARSVEAPVSPLTRRVWVFWIGSAQLQGDARSVSLDIDHSPGDAPGALNAEHAEEDSQDEE